MNIAKETLNTEKENFRTEFADKTSTYMYKNKTVKMQNDTKTKDADEKLKDVEEADMPCSIKEEKTLEQYSSDLVENTNIKEKDIDEIKEVKTKGVEIDQIKNDDEEDEIENEKPESENSYAFKNCISRESIRAEEMLNSKNKLNIEEIKRKTLSPMEEESNIFSLKCENDKNISLKKKEENKITNEENILEMDIEKKVIENPHVSKTNSKSDIFVSYSDNLELFNFDEDEKEILSSEITEFCDEEIEKKTDKDNKNDTFSENVKICIDNDLTLDDDAESLVMEELAKSEKEEKEEKEEEEAEEEKRETAQDEYSNENISAVVTKNNNEVDKMTSDKHVETMEDTKDDKKDDKKDDEETENQEKCASIDIETDKEKNETNIKKDVTDLSGVVELKEVIKQDNFQINKIEKLKSQPLYLRKKNAKQVSKIKENKKFPKKMSIIYKTKASLCKVQSKKKAVAEGEKVKNGIKKVIEKSVNKKKIGTLDTEKCTNYEDINFKNSEQIKKEEKTNNKENKANDKNNTLPNINQYNFSNIKIKKFDVFHNLPSIDRNENENENVVEVKKIEETETEEKEVKISSKTSFIVTNENTEYENESNVEIANSGSNSSIYNEDINQDKNKNKLVLTQNMKQNNTSNNIKKLAENQKVSSYSYKMNKVALHKKVNVLNKAAQKTDLDKKHDKISFKSIKQVLNGSNLNYATYDQDKKNPKHIEFTDYPKWNISNILKEKQVRTVGTQKCFTKKMVDKGVNTSNFVCATNDNKKIALPNFIYTPSLKLQNYNFDAIRVENGRVVPDKMDISKLVFQNS